jgi:multicomponent Na+:H+ antiporter subunit A
MTMHFAVLSGFGAALVAPFLTRRLQGLTSWVLALVPAGLTVYFLSLLPSAAAGGATSASLAWVPALGLNVALRADGLSLIFALLISGIGTLVVIYAGGYLKGDAHLNRFYAWLLTFMASMLGVVLADNLILLYVFWELTTLSSFLLIGYESEREEARAAALQALLVTGAGGLALLGGLVLLGQAAGTYQLSAVVAQAEAVRASGLYYPILILVLLGAFAKSAQFPFHFWLPNAMEAPTPVSAYLHSATMVKAGIYLMARMSPVLGGTDAWTYAVAITGGVTMVVGAYLALTQTDLKRLLAYSTIGALGMLTFLIGLGEPLALEAAMVLLVAHGLYKGAMFLVAGAVDHETGTRDVTRLGGLRAAMPVTAFAAGLAAISMAGFPPALGYLSKELFYEVALHYQPWVVAAAVLVALFTVYVAFVAGIGPFWGRSLRAPKTPHEAPFSLWLGPVILAGLGILFGALPGLIGPGLVAPAASAALGQALEVSLKLWHGFNLTFILSMLTLLAGAILFLAQKQVRGALVRAVSPYGMDRLYEASLVWLNVLARGQTRILQNGYLRVYLLVIVITTVGLAGSTILLLDGFHMPEQVTIPTFYEVALGVLILAAAFAAIRSRSRLGAVAALGVTGYSVALIFLIFGAPDLAMTQFLVESLTVILFVFAFYHLPHFKILTTRRPRMFHAAVSLLAGGLMTALVLSAVGLNLYPPISDYFLEQSVPLAHGRNIVNVILVDFRGTDTLGEITVLAVAAVGVIALLKFRREGQK